MYQDIDVDAGCGKYFSNAVESMQQTPIRIVWTGANRFSVFVGAAEPIAWDMHLDATPASRALGRFAAALPAPLLRVRLLARTIGSAAGMLLRAGALTLTGSTPNGFYFVARPDALWYVTASRATIGSRTAGEVVLNREDVLLGDFRIPRRGLFAIAKAVLRPAKAVAALAAAVAGALGP